jgi:hypothetical protein
MARFVALLLVLCTLGVIVADAQCGVWCSVSQCNSTHPETGCHHHNRQPSSQQCLHQHNLTQTWMRTASSTAIPLQVAGLAAWESPASVLDGTSRISMLAASAEQPPGLQTQTTLRI